MSDPYIIPRDDGPYTLNFSGGRSSGYMMHHILEANGGLPDNVQVIFCNTGKERNETLDFVQECGTRWGVPITWLEYRHVPTAAGGRKDPKHRHAVVNHNSASRDGEPYEALIAAKSMLPNITMSFCTSDLKVKPTRWFVQRDLGWTSYRSIIGIRHDEPRRWGKALMEECSSDFPMVHARVTKQQVGAWWRKQPFDLGIDSDEGNCDLCFKKGRGKLEKLIHERPESVEWWLRMEQEVVKAPAFLDRGFDKPEMGRFSKRFSYQELVDVATSPDWKPPPEQLELDVDCFCGFDE